MLMVKDSLLTLKFNGCYLGERLYSGVALIIQAGVVVDKQLYENGKEKELDFLLPFPKFKSSIIDVDFDSLEGIEEPYFLNETEFSGCAFKFHNDVCISIIQYEFGFAVSDATFQNGCLTRLEFSDEDGKFSQAFNWEEDGTYGRYRITDQGQFNFSLAFINNKITTLTIDGQYFNKISTLKSKVSYLNFNETDFAKGLMAASYLYVSGSEVDDTVFSDLIEKRGLEDTSRLRIARTAITSATLYKLSGLIKLQDLSVESDIMTLDDLQEFKLNRPDCNVEFNRQEVSF